MYVMIPKYKDLTLSVGFLRTELSFKKLRVTGMDTHFSLFSNELILCVWGLVKENVVNTILRDSVLKNM